MSGRAALDEWYFRQGRSLLNELAPGCLAHVERSVDGDRRTLNLRLYVVGAAGVGKSTLVNALLSDRMALMPQGGLGPFTAAHARVVFDEEPYVRVTYAVAERLAEVVRGLRGAPTSGMQNSLLAARLLVEDNQFGSCSPLYLEKVLASAAGGSLSSEAREADRGRLSVLAELVRTGTQTFVRCAGQELPAMLLDLRLHCAGFLAPVTTDIQVGWSAPFLASGVELIDLPGVGVANDSFGASAKDALEGARSVLLVVNRAGLSRAAADLLGPLFRSHLLEPQATRLVVAITQLDLVATDAWHDQPLTSQQDWLFHFDAAARAARALVRAQLRAELSRIVRELGIRRERATTLANDIDLRPVAPVEHRKLARGSAREPSFLPHLSESRIGALRELLGQHGHSHRRELASQFATELERASQRLDLAADRRAAAATARASLATAVGDQ